MKIKMVDGKEYDLSQFEFICEEKDTAGRHFKGYADIVVDLTDDMSVDPEFRNYYIGNAYWDGDWGFDYDTVVWNISEPLLEYSFNIAVGDRWNDGHGRWDGYLIKCNLPKHEVFDGINKAAEEYRGIYQLCDSNRIIRNQEYEALESLGVDLSPVHKLSDAYCIDSEWGFIDLFMNIAQSKLDQKLFYTIEDIDYDEFPASGYGLKA